MRYTVWSGHHQIGVTDLGFLYRAGASRTGWFFPSADGDGLMPEIVEPLIGAFMERWPKKAAGEPFTKQEFACQAEYQKACRRAARWNLRLRRDDGSLVPTETVAIRDTEALLALYAPDSETSNDDSDDVDDLFDDDPSEAWKRDPEDDDYEAEAAPRRNIEQEVELVEDRFEERVETHQATADDEPLPRYQIWVLLSDPSAVP